MKCQAYMTRMVREPSPQMQNTSRAVPCFVELRIWVKYSDSGSKAKCATSHFEDFGVLCEVV